MGTGFLTGDVLREVLLHFPFVIVGALLGIWLSGRIDETGFRRFSLSVLALLGVLGVVSGAGII